MYVAPFSVVTEQKPWCMGVVVFLMANVVSHVYAVRVSGAAVWMRECGVVRMFVCSGFWSFA